MESDVEGQPNGKLSLNESVLKDDKGVKNDVDISVSSSTKGDIETKLGNAAKSDEVFTSGETENSLGDLTENNPGSGNSLETVGNYAKVENEKRVDEKLENQNPAEKCISDAVKNTVAEDAGKIYDKLEPNSATKLVDKSRIDLLDKENVTDLDKSFEINSAVDIEPKSPEIGFRRKSLSQFSPLSSPVRSPSQMSETSPVKSPELGGRRRLKVHVFDRELGAPGGGTSNQEQSSERNEDKKVKEDKMHTPDFMGKEQVTENQESSPSKIDNTASTSSCIEEESSKDLNLLDSDKCIQDVMEGEFFKKHTEGKPMPCFDKLPENSELSKEASPLNKPLLKVERKLSLSFYRKETTSLYAKGIDENESDVNNSTSSEDFCKVKDSDPEKPEDGLVRGKSEINIGHEEPEDSITPENPQDIIVPEKPDGSIAPEKDEDSIPPEELEEIIPPENPEVSIPSEKPEDSIAPEIPEESISFDNHEGSVPSDNLEDSMPSENSEDSMPSENSEDSITSEKSEDTIAPEEPEDNIPSENPGDSMPYENRDVRIPSETHEGSIPSEDSEDSKTSEKPEDTISPEEPEDNILSENPEDSMPYENRDGSIPYETHEDSSIPSENSKDSITTEKPGDTIAPEEPEDDKPSENPEDSMPYGNRDGSIHSETRENSLPSENSKDSITSEKPGDIIAPDEPEDSIPSENPEDSMPYENRDGSIPSEIHEDDMPSENSKDSITSEKPGDIIAPEEPEDSIPSEIHEDSMPSENPEDSLPLEKQENSIAPENPDENISSESPEDSIHSDKYEAIIAPEKPKDSLAHEKHKDSVASIKPEKSEDGIAFKKPEDNVVSEKPEDSVASEKPEDNVASEIPEDSVASKRPEDSVAFEKLEDNEASGKPEDNVASEKPEDSVTSGKPEDNVASVKPEDSVASEKSENSVASEKPEDSVTSEKPEDSVASEKSENSAASEKPEDSVASEKSENSVASEKPEDNEASKKPVDSVASSSLLSLCKRSALADQKRKKVEVGDKDVKPLTADTEEKSRTDERSLEDDQKVGNVENDQGSGTSSDGSYEGMRVSGEDTEIDHSLPESDILNPSERVQSITSSTLSNEKLQLTGDSLGDEGSGGTHVMKRKKRSRDSDPGKSRGVPGPKRSKVSLDTKENTDHDNKDDVEVSSSGTSPVDMKVEFVDISSEEEQQSESRYKDAIDMVCKKCRDIWNDEVLRMIFKGTESVTVNSKITYGAIVCINDWINRNLSVDKEEAITQVFERTDLGSNIAQLNITKLDQWLGELLHRGKNKCCKVFTAVYQPKKDTALHKTKAGTKKPKVHVSQGIPIPKNQKSAVSIGQKSSGTKGPPVAKSQSLTGNKSQSPTANKGQSSVIATCPDLPKGRVYLVPAPAVASVLPSALSAKSLPNEESAVLPSSASSLMKPCKIILKNPVPVRTKDNIQNPNRPSTKSHPLGSSAGLKSGESKTTVSSKCPSRSPIGKPGLSSSRDKSLRPTGHGNTFNSKELSKTGGNKVPILQQARPLSKMMSQGQIQRAHVMEYEQDEQEDVKGFVTEVESMIFSQEPVIREMLQALNLDIKDVNIYSSYCNIPVNNKMKVDCPSERDKISPCYFSMLKERSALNGHALIAFDLLLYESNNQHSVTSLGSIKSRFVTKRELLTLQSIFILNPETPDISLFYEVFVQILLSRKKVLLIPDSHTFLVVTENIRKEYNRVKSKDLSIQILNENWDPNNIYSADDAWLEGQNLNLEEVTNRDVISIFCTWRNLGKEPNDQSLSKALQSLRQFHNIRNGDYFGSCYRLYTKFIRFVYEEKELELAKVLLDEPFIGGCCIVSKKFLQNLINFKKQKNNLPNYDDDVDDIKDAVERFEELETMAYENLNASILRDLCSQMIIVEEKLKVFNENNEVIGKRLTDLLGKRERLLREIKGPENRRLVQTMRASIVELHKVAQKRRQESYYNKKNKRRKSDLDMVDSDLESSCTDVSPHIKELVKDLLSKGVKPDKVRQVMGIVSGVTNEETVLEIPSEKWILKFAQMCS
ncbi:titin homolog [Macrobrachium nipponense]|uniref:titin homolog n=1 Tax=Macrobrachium nipponense TaxID=159736 RepID=UPI0030C8D013